MVLITGGEGFIGQYIIRDLYKNNISVVSVDLDKGKYMSLKGYKYVNCDLENIEIIETILNENDIDCIVHMASMLNSASKENPIKATKVNILGTMNLLNLCKKYNIGRFIYGSSISIYGKVNKDTYVDEDKPSYTKDVYGASKKYVEILGENLLNQEMIRFISVRIPVVVGKGAIKTSSVWRHELFDKLWTQDIHRIKIPFSKCTIFPISHVEDTAKFITSIVTKKEVKHSIYNSPCESITFDEIEKMIENKQLEFLYTDVDIDDIPSYISCKRAKSEFIEAYNKLEYYFQGY